LLPRPPLHGVARLPAAHICEGLDHADAPPTDVDEAARKLKLATLQEYHKLLAAKSSQRQQQQRQQQQQVPALVAELLQAGALGQQQHADAGSTNDCSSSKTKSSRARRWRGGGPAQ
jgi:DNA-binding protein H-NS